MPTRSVHAHVMQCSCARHALRAPYTARATQVLLYISFARTFPTHARTNYNYSRRLAGRLVKRMTLPMSTLTPAASTPVTLAIATASIRERTRTARTATGAASVLDQVAARAAPVLDQVTARAAPVLDQATAKAAPVLDQATAKAAKATRPMTPTATRGARTERRSLGRSALCAKALRASYSGVWITTSCRSSGRISEKPESG